MVSEDRPEDPEQFARDAVYRLLTVRARSRAELMGSLSRKGVEEEVAEAVVGKFVDAGLVDDAAFADSWVRQRHEYQGLGRKALAAELRNKGVDEEAASAALAQVASEDEAERARELVRRKLRGMTTVDSTTRTRRLVAMLARKGYSEGMAFRVVREELDASGSDGQLPEEADW
ncbi:regulatory protein [Saccharopolyspora lacisalsi]|uniref:Regulatory protein RecX n=1 Tax=Halosaccharopolyspora lacisalsi TaxID=1000566 RepID=A0A839DZH0_9PSEU|nr:regulatory protein RecX [Halosaccharopolyspora lacisalsi]MBA8825646.1 regulatory protein [Halosaccharopolyspora lacisalsi]